MIQSTRSAWCSRTHFDADDDEGTVNKSYIHSSKEKQRQAETHTYIHAIIMNVNNGHYAMVNAS